MLKHCRITSSIHLLPVIFIATACGNKTNHNNSSPIPIQSQEPSSPSPKPPNLATEEMQVVCEAWYQANGENLQQLSMPITKQTSNNIIYTISYKGYDYKVDWNKNLTTFYIFIENSGKPVLFTTAREPTPNHSENFTDLNLPNGLRLSVNCEIKK